MVSRRKFSNQENVLSTIHRLGRTWNLLGHSSGRSTTSTTHPNFPANHLPDERMERIHDVLNNTLQFPFTEVVINRLPWRKVAWKHSPLATGLIDIEDGVHDVTKLRFSLSFLRINNFFIYFKTATESIHSLIREKHSVPIKPCGHPQNQADAGLYHRHRPRRLRRLRLDHLPLPEA